MYSIMTPLTDIPLFCRSYYSLLNGSVSPGALCARAAQLGYRSVCLVDHSAFYGLPEFLKEAAYNGLTPLAGVFLPKIRLTLLCINPRGFARANTIVSRLLLANTRRDTPERFRRFLDLTAGEYPGDSNDSYDPVADLCEKGWEGVWLASSDPETLERLGRSDRRNVYVALYYGQPFAGIAAWGGNRGFPPIAMGDAAWIESEDRDRYRVARAIDRGTTVYSLGQWESLTDAQTPVAPSAISTFFETVPQALANAARFTRIGDARDFVSQKPVFPRYRDLPEAEELRLLRSKCEEGMLRRYGVPDPVTQNRLDYELRIIGEKGFSGYFLVVQDIVAQCPRTCGRGSSAASIVSYLLGITHVDPIRHNLFFERFLNMGRTDPPDVDVDFPWDERHGILGYVLSSYPGRAAMVADHVTFGPRSSIREPAKALAVSEEEVGRFVRLLRHGKDTDVPEQVRTASELVRGMPRHIGTHPGGIVITPRTMDSYVHTQLSPLGLPVIGWEKDGAEEAGLVKIDLLGNRSLSVLRDCIALINNRRSLKVTWETLQPIDDLRTRALIEKGDTLGVFYVESPATRQLLKKMGVGDYEHLVVASSIIRPAANKLIGEYVRRLKGGQWRPLHPRLEQTLSETLGIMVYQEDVSRVAIDLAGMDATEADSLRKVLSKRDRRRKMGSFKDRFYRGAAANGADQKCLDNIWEMIMSFEGYSFCKAHSASFALLSYRLAWMKENYPLEFITSVINNGGGFYSRQVYLNAARRMGFSLLGPDVNRSEVRYQTDSGALRLGLSQIRGLPGPFADALVEERETNGPYLDLDDFLDRVIPNRSDVTLLIKSGCLDSISGGLTRPAMVWSCATHDRKASLFQTTNFAGPKGDYSSGKKLLDERNTLDVVISCHPLELYVRRIREICTRRRLPAPVSSRELSIRIGRSVTIAGILATGKEVRTSAGRYMCFASFEDPFAIFETVLFPDVYQSMPLPLEVGYPYVMMGRVVRDYESIQLEVSGLVCLAARRG